MDSRAQFEEYIRRTFTYALLERHEEEAPFKGEYIEAFRETEWELWQAAWQAAHAAIEVTLPEKVMVEDEYDRGHNYGIEYCEEAIKAAGIRIKGDS